MKTQELRLQTRYIKFNTSWEKFQELRHQVDSTTTATNEEVAYELNS